MKISTFYAGSPEVDKHVEFAVNAEKDGFDGCWYGQVAGADVLTVIALAGQKTSRIELGTSVVPTYVRHPTIMAQQALTVQAATGGRFTLGLGLSHAPVVQGMWGLSYERPAVHMREYLNVVQPLLTDGMVSFNGEMFRVNAQASVPTPEPPQVMIAALAPVMLKMAGERTGGTITWMCGPKTIQNHIVPRLTKAAEGVGRPQPRVVSSLPIAVTDDSDTARQRAANLFAVYGALPNYRRMLDIEGVDGPKDLAIVGNEAQVEQQIRDVASAGATEFVANSFPADDDAKASLARTNALLKSLIGKI